MNICILLPNHVRVLEWFNCCHPFINSYAIIVQYFSFILVTFHKLDIILIIYPHLYSYLGSLFFLTSHTVQLGSLSFWSTFFRISYSEGLLVPTFPVYDCLNNAFISLSFLKEIYKSLLMYFKRDLLIYHGCEYRDTNIKMSVFLQIQHNFRFHHVFCSFV